ncbi:Vps53-like [Phytophthora infestans]|uniref:Vps53-like n=1 Tax=Phytophthora infestans TaxID=4787 RepID=A0A833VY78_PHYIN|nr:Vps53-like [Phytophthora infestans]
MDRLLRHGPGPAILYQVDCQVSPTSHVQVLPSEDLLDRPEFDAREFINRNFPDEQSLGDIGDFVSRLRGRMKELDDSLSQASQDQSLAAHQALLDLKEAKTASQQLSTRSTISELDYAKRHLQTTLTALKRLHMLVNAVDQLEFMSSQRRTWRTDLCRLSV